MKLQDKPTLLPSTQRLTGLKQIHRAGFNSTAGFTARDKLFVYACGRNVVLDYENSNQLQLIAHDATVSCLCVSNNMLIASGQLASPGSKNYDSPIYLWKVGDINPMARYFGLKEGVKALLFSEDCRYLAGVSYKDQLMVWDLKTQTELLTKNFENPVLILNFSNESIVLVIGKGIHSLSLTSLITQNKPPTLTNFTLPSTGLPRNYTSLLALGNGLFVIGTESGELCIFYKGIFKSGLVGGKGKVYSVALYDKQVLASIGNELVKLDIAGQQLKQKDRRPVSQIIRNISVTEKGQIYGISNNSILRLSSDLKYEHVKLSHSSKIKHSSARNGIIASIDEEGTIICQYYKSGEVSLLSLWRYPQAQVAGVCVQVSANNILAGFSDGKLVGLASDGKKAEWDVNAHKGRVTAIYSNQSYILTGGQDCVVRIWSKSRQLINQVSAHQKPVSKVLGDILASNLIHSCSLDRSLQTYDMKSDKKLYFRQALGGNVTDMIQDQRNGQLITCGVGSTVSFWKSNQHQSYKNLQPDSGNIVKLALNPSGTILALGYDNGVLSLYSIKNGSHLGAHLAHSAIITGVSWIADNILATVSQDYSVIVWGYQ